MPVYPCHHPTCRTFVPARGDYCDAHREAGRRERSTRDRYYDQHLRNPEAKAFYNSAAWQWARTAALTRHPVCQRCGRAWARHVHHKKPLTLCSPAERTHPDILMSVCVPCHNEIEAEVARGVTLAEIQDLAASLQNTPRPQTMPLDEWVKGGRL